MINIRQQEDLFIAIGKMLKRKINVYAIGGTAMMLRGIKNSTLDIDLVFEKNKDRFELSDVLKKLGAKESDVTLVYGLKNNTPLMLELEDSRFDLFMRKIITSNFSDNMKKRAKQVHEFGNFILNVADPIDILIMKSVTSRAKDLEDIISIVKSEKIDWEILINESKEQAKLGNETAVISLGEKLEKLKEQKVINVPQEVLDNLWKFFKKQVKEKSKK